MLAELGCCCLACNTSIKTHIQQLLGFGLNTYGCECVCRGNTWHIPQQFLAPASAFLQVSITGFLRSTSCLQTSSPIPLLPPVTSAYKLWLDMLLMLLMLLLPLVITEVKERRTMPKYVVYKT
jgi:hypothetical protein